MIVCDGYARWCEAHGCDHGHCPTGHDKPQPIWVEAEGRLVCGRCAVLDGVVRDMVPCVPGVCE